MAVTPARFTEQLIIMADKGTRALIDELARERWDGNRSAAGREVIAVGLAVIAEREKTDA